MKDALQLVQEKQSEGEIASIIQGLGGEIGGLSDNYRRKVTNTVMKEFKTIKADRAKGTGASSLLNAIIDGTWHILIPEAENITTKKAAETDSGNEVTIK